MKVFLSVTKQISVKLTYSIEFYSQIEQLSASDDAEASMISKMKHTCGYNYTNKLQRMYQVINKMKTIIFFKYPKLSFFIILQIGH